MNENAESKTRDFSEEDFLIKIELQNPELRELHKKMEQEYDCLLTNICTVIKQSCTSLQEITAMIKELDNKLN